jgi:hypothetical protein
MEKKRFGDIDYCGQAFADIVASLLLSSDILAFLALILNFSSGKP